MLSSISGGGTGGAAAGSGGCALHGGAAIARKMAAAPAARRGRLIMGPCSNGKRRAFAGGAITYRIGLKVNRFYNLAPMAFRFSKRLRPM